MNISNICENLNKIYFLSILFLSISIPINFRVSLYALAFALLFGLLLILKNKSIFINVRYNIKRILFIFLWLLYAISLFYTQDLKYGVDILIKVISLLLVPFLISFNLSDKQIINLKKYFIISTSVVLLFFITRAFVNSCSIIDGVLHFNFYNEKAIWGSYFYYIEFVKPHHPSYFAMYIILAIVFIFEQIKVSNNNIEKLYLFALIGFLSFGLILTSSRAGLLTYFIVIILSIYWLLKKKGRAIAIFLSLLLFPTFVYFLSLNPRLKTIFTYSKSIYENNIQIKDQYENSYMVRILMWPSILKDLNINEILFGVGIGDTKQRFIETYIKRNIRYAIDEQLNAHNQYIQTLVSIGLIGLGILVSILGYSFWLAYRKRDMVLFLFLIIISVNFMFESVLERVFGVIFFVFFLLFLSSKSEPKTDAIDF